MSAIGTSTCELEVTSQAMGRLIGFMQEGPQRPDIQSQDIADLLLGLVQGLVLRWQLSGHRFDLEREGARLIACQLGLLQQEKGKQP